MILTYEAVSLSRIDGGRPIPIEALVQNTLLSVHDVVL
jgi:hypothetical protein